MQRAEIAVVPTAEHRKRDRERWTEKGEGGRNEEERDREKERYTSANFPLSIARASRPSRSLIRHSIAAIDATKDAGRGQNSHVIGPLSVARS